MATWILCAVYYARLASCVVLDHPCSGNSFRDFKKTSYIYHPSVAREKYIEDGRVRKNDRKNIVVMGGERDN